MRRNTPISDSPLVAETIEGINHLLQFLLLQKGIQDLGREMDLLAFALLGIEEKLRRRCFLRPFQPIPGSLRPNRNERDDYLWLDESCIFHFATSESTN